MRAVVRLKEPWLRSQSFRGEVTTLGDTWVWLKRVERWVDSGAGVWVSVVGRDQVGFPRESIHLVQVMHEASDGADG